jgi:hypothetical protein
VQMGQFPIHAFLRHEPSLKTKSVSRSQATIGLYLRSSELAVTPAAQSYKTISPRSGQRERENLTRAGKIHQSEAPSTLLTDLV